MGETADRVTVNILVCAKCATPTGDVKAAECDVCGEELNEMHVVKAVEGTLDFKEGDKGTGVLQVHERGLSEMQATKLAAFGWSPVKLTDSQFAVLDAIDSSVPWRKFVEQAAKGNAAELGKEVGPHVRRDDLTDEQRHVLALVDPVSIHTDFRMRPEGADYWEGGEGFTPGNQFAPNKLKLIAEGNGSVDKVLGNFKLAEEGGTRSGTTIRGPVSWLKVGDPSPRAFPPGAPGGTTHAWSRIAVVDKFRWRAGVQDPHFKEFEFDGGVLKGRWIFQYVPVAEGRREWMISRPDDQELKADKKPQEGEGEKGERAYFVNIVKAEKRLVTGVVLQPETVDAQGDIVGDEAIEEGAHKFMEAYYARRAVLGVQHKDYNRDLELVESYVTPSEMILNGNSVKAGSWLMTIKVNDNSIWNAVKRGELTGLSIKGKVRVIRA